MLLLAIAVGLAGCGCEHVWTEADCMMPKTCQECGETEGMLADHVAGEWVFLPDANGNKHPGIRTQLCENCSETIATEPGLLYNSDGTYKTLPEFMAALETEAERLKVEAEGWECGKLHTEAKGGDYEHMYAFYQEGNPTHVMVGGKFEGSATTANGKVDSAFVWGAIDDEADVQYTIALGAALWHLTDPTIGTFEECQQMIAEMAIENQGAKIHNGLEYDVIYLPLDEIMLMITVDIPD